MGGSQELIESEADPWYMVIPKGYSLVCKMCVISKSYTLSHQLHPVWLLLAPRLQSHVILSKHLCRTQCV